MNQYSKHIYIYISVSQDKQKSNTHRRRTLLQQMTKKMCAAVSDGSLETTRVGWKKPRAGTPSRAVRPILEGPAQVCKAPMAEHLHREEKN